MTMALRIVPRRILAGRVIVGAAIVLIVAGAALFGVGWGLVGLCPGPAIADLATLSPGVIVFVIAMAVGMLGHDLWQSRASRTPERSLVGAGAADG